MSRETRDWKRNNIMVGFTGVRGNAWWNARGQDGTRDDGTPNHFDGPVPVERVRQDLFGWQAERRAIYQEVPGRTEITEDGVTVIPAHMELIPNRVAIARNDNDYAMGIFKDGYEPHQLVGLVDDVSNILDDTLAIGSAGLLRGGAVGWVSVEVPENIVTPEGVEFRPNLFAVTSFDGTIATTYKRCVTNIVCDNTLEAARMESGQQLKIRHTRNARIRIASAREALAIVHSAAEDFTAEVKTLSEIKVTDKQFGKFLDLLSPEPVAVDGKEPSKRTLTLSENRRATLTHLWKSDPRVHPWAGTGYGVLQMVNTFDQHYQTVRQNAGSDQETAFLRWERSILGAVNGDLSKRTDDVLAMLAVATGK